MPNILSLLISRAACRTIRYWERVNAFSTAFTRGVPHGVIAAIHLPEPFGEIPSAVLHRLHADERDYAAQLDGHRKVQWIGGRLAAHHAVRALGKDMGALLSDAQGAPIPPKGLEISISHKAELAVAIASKNGHGTIGIDLEILGRDRRHIAEKILRPEELEIVSNLPDEHQWGATLIRFAVKEATYKALAPRLNRYIAFQEASIGVIKDGTAHMNLHLETTDGPKSIEARYEWMPEGLIATVRARWA